jgi:molybdenum cofactor biosynthesis enzyme
MTARLREAQRREDAALEYAKNVQSQLNQANQRYQTSDQHRMAEAKSRIETQAVALKQIVRKAREEGDMGHGDGGAGAFVAACCGAKAASELRSLD